MRSDRRRPDDGPDWLGTLLMAVLALTLVVMTLR
jgi:hypothetical protein